VQANVCCSCLSHPRNKFLSPLSVLLPRLLANFRGRWTKQALTYRLTEVGHAWRGKG
jgi:hypothetical protein